MGTTLKIFKKCARNRKEPLALVLNLLIFLAVCTRAVSSVPLEERNLQIPALGRISQLGSLYDARTDSFSDVSIFNSNLPSHLITTTNTPRVKKESQIIKKESDKFKIFGVDLETAASIQTGMVQPEGAASMMSEDVTSSADVTGVFLQTFQTAKQTFSILQGALRNYYHTDFQLFEGATHIVTGIHWGCNIAVKFTDNPSRKQKSAQKSILLRKEMAKLKKASRNISNKTISFEMYLTTDVFPQNAFPAPTSLRKIQDQINQVQESIKITNSGFGVPLKFTLTPISVLKKYLNVTTTTETKAYKLNERTLREYFNIIDDIKPAGKALTKLEDNSNCIPNKVHNEFEQVRRSFIAAKQDFEILFKKVFLDVKSGNANNSALSEVLKNYKSKETNPKIVPSALALHDQARLKADFCSQLNEEYPDIEYFGSVSNLISKIYQNHNKLTYVLFTKSKFKENDRVSYEDNWNIFLNLLYKPTNALFIVDCDFSYTQCESINGTVIKQIRRANYTFDDVRMEIKITETENKTEIVECNKESGMTGAFCVSKNTRASPKLGEKKPNKSKNLPTESRSSKVAGGKDASRSEFPFQILFLKNAGDVHCGGSILDENFVLTAAHCFYEGVYQYDAAEYENRTIVAGDHNRGFDEGSEQSRRIRDVYIHEKFIPIADVNDIAIVKLDHPLQWSPQVQQILLPDEDYEAGDDVVVTGWGRLRVGGVNPNVLQKVTVPIVDRADCVEAYAERQVFVSIKMMCAGDVIDGGEDACHGDSGGPLSVKLSNGSSILVGIVSGGIGCASAKYPGIYMQVSKYVDWISETLTHFEIVTDDCLAAESEPCKNGGTCVDAINSFKCVCAAGYEVPDCATVTNNCAHTKSCFNGGTCVNGFNSYSCVCAAGYEGRDCSTVTNNCAPSESCLNGGTCVNQINSYSCVCAAGYEGSDCATVTNYCARRKSCLNGGTCSNGINSYSCVCAAGYEGEDCASFTNYCARSAPCLNEGTCVNRIYSYSCVCAAGYEGPHCATVTNSCARRNSCLNGGTCVDGFSSYRCVCAAGYEGTHCATVTNNCAGRKSCLNGGTCINGINSYSCVCAAGYEGPDCVTVTNNCALSLSCLNGGTCIDGIGTYSCVCAEKFDGIHCESNSNKM